MSNRLITRSLSVLVLFMLCTISLECFSQKRSTFTMKGSPPWRPMRITIKLLFVLFIFVSCCPQSKMIKGAWISEDSPAVDYIILDNNKIWFFEAPDTNTYEIKGKIFYSYEQGHLLATYKILKLTNDSLVLQTEDGTIVTRSKMRQK